MNKVIKPLLRAESKLCIPKRNWNQSGMIVSTPARVPVSWAVRTYDVLKLRAKLVGGVASIFVYP